MSHTYTDPGGYLAQYTIVNESNGDLRETCYQPVYVYRCGDGFKNGTEECDGLDQAQCGEGATCSSSCTCIVDGQCGVASGAVYYST